MNKENLFLKIINQTIADNSYLGDDCAYIADLELLVSHDTLVEKVHFCCSYFTPCEIGKKAVLVNLSDIISGGGVPKYITISLSGNLSEDFIRGFYSGANEIAEKFNVKIIGGDLTGGNKIVVSICILGKTQGGKISSRKNARPGDFVFVKGIHGNSAMGLKLLLNGVYTGANEQQSRFIYAHKQPVLYPEFARKIALGAFYPYVMTDTSDGLYDSLYRVSMASGAGFEIDFSKIPREIEDKNTVLFGGEDFGLLICLNPKDAYLANGAALIGKVTDNKKILIDGASVEKNETYDHFDGRP